MGLSQTSDPAACLVFFIGMVEWILFGGLLLLFDEIEREKPKKKAQMSLEEWGEDIAVFCWATFVAVGGFFIFVWIFEAVILFFGGSDLQGLFGGILIVSGCVGVFFWFVLFHEEPAPKKAIPKKKVRHTNAIKKSTHQPAPRSYTPPQTTYASREDRVFAEIEQVLRTEQHQALTQGSGGGLVVSHAGSGAGQPDRAAMKRVREEVERLKQGI